MKSNTQNAKIEAITEKTLVLGIDVGSETHYNIYLSAYTDIWLYLSVLFVCILPMHIDLMRIIW